MHNKKIVAGLSFAGIAIAMFAGTLDSTIVNIALPKIMAAFDTSLNATSWVTTIYVLALAVFMITSAKLADQLGRKKVMLCGLLLFGSASAACMFAPSLGYLIAYRFFQGLGGAIITPLAVPMGLEIFGKRHLGALSAAVGAITALAAAGGPPLGGLLLQVVSWRWLFGINVPLTLVAIGLIAGFTTESTDPTVGRQFDPVGTGLLTLGLAGLCFGLLQGRQLGWQTPLIVTSFVVGGLALVAFIIVENRVTAPLIELQLFRNKVFAASTFIYFITGFSLVCPTLIFNYFLQNILGYTPLHAALLIIPVSLTVVVAMPLGTRLLAAVGAIPVNLAGMLLVAASLFTFSWIKTDTAPTFMALLMVLNGWGFGFTTVSLVAAITQLPQEKSGIGSGIVNAGRQIGTCLGIALLVTVLNSNVATAKNTIWRQANQVVAQSRLAPAVKSATRATLHNNLQATTTQTGEIAGRAAIAAAARQTSQLPTPAVGTPLAEIYRGGRRLQQGQARVIQSGQSLVTMLTDAATQVPQLATPAQALKKELSASQALLAGQTDLTTGLQLLAQQQALAHALDQIKQHKNRELARAFSRTYLVAGTIILLCAPVALLTDQWRQR